VIQYWKVVFKGTNLPLIQNGQILKHISNILRYKKCYGNFKHWQGHIKTIVLEIFWIRYVKVMSLQSYKTQNLKFWEFQNSPFGSLWKLCHFDVVPITIYKIYYRDENGDSFKFGLQWVIWMHVSHDFIYATFWFPFALIFPSFFDCAN